MLYKKNKLIVVELTCLYLFKNENIKVYATHILV